MATPTRHPSRNVRRKSTKNGAIRSKTKPARKRAAPIVHRVAKRPSSHASHAKQGTRNKHILNKKMNVAVRHPQRPVADESPHLKKIKIGSRVESVPGVTKRGTTHANIASEDESMAAIKSLVASDAAVGYLKKNISKRSVDVLNMLAVPKTDEDIAQQLDMKINAVRRMLNLMQGCGITNYYVAKNVNGWLSFAWYVNVSKVPSFLEYAQGLENRKPLTLTDCNDYFICNDCYGKNGLIFTFDAAFEGNFKCGVCGSGLEMIGKDKALELTENQNKPDDIEEPLNELGVEADV